MQKTNIPWTEWTWNPSVGCELPLASIGCEQCYARRLHNTRHKAYLAGKKLPIQYAKPFEEIQLFTDRLDEPLRKRNPCNIFVGSMTDLFCPSVPEEFQYDVLEVVRRCPQHIFQFLTKRPENALAMKWEYTAFGVTHYYRNLPNLWFGASISNQSDADRIIPVLLKIPAAVRFVSIEPMLGEIDIKKYVYLRQQCVGKKGCGFTGASYEFWNPKKEGAYRCPKCRKTHTYLVTDSIDWVIVGAESGPKRRYCDTWAWVNPLVEQCKEANVPCFVKQLHDSDTSKLIKPVIEPDLNGWPREYPKGA